MESKRRGRDEFGVFDIEEPRCEEAEQILSTMGRKSIDNKYCIRPLVESHSNSYEKCESMLAVDKETLTVWKDGCIVKHRHV